MKKILLLVSVLAMSLLLVSCPSAVIPQEPITPSQPIGNSYGTPGIANSHCYLGNPSDAVNNIGSADNYLMSKDQYVMSYNNSKRTANWVAWHLCASDIGSVDRQDDFRVDTQLPDEWFAVGEYSLATVDYQNSTYGFDRGHLCPSADRTSSVEDNSATFLMTNMIPQAPKNNQQTWKNLEDYERDLVAAGNELFIIAGPAGIGGTSAKGSFDYIVLDSANNVTITIPAYTWKIIVSIPEGTNDINRITKDSTVFAVYMPNTQNCSSKSWQEYKVSIDFLEETLGYDFLENIPDSIENVLEAIEY